METSELIRLLKQVEPHRNEDVLLDGDLVPKSASMLVSVLADKTDPIDRLELYTNIIIECYAAGKAEAAVKIAQAQYREFGDVAALVAYSNALVGNGEFAEGLIRAKEALDMAIRRQTLINYAAGNFVRESVKTGSVETVNAALDALVSSTQVSRTGDCALEVDWADEAEALGADVELISWVRSVAARK